MIFYDYDIVKDNEKAKIDSLGNVVSGRTPIKNDRILVVADNGNEFTIKPGRNGGIEIMNNGRGWQTGLAMLPHSSNVVEVISI